MPICRKCGKNKNNVDMCVKRRDENRRPIEYMPDCKDCKYAYDKARAAIRCDPIPGFNPTSQEWLLKRF